MVKNGSEILVEALVEQGVDTIFGYPGGAVLNIYDALYKNSDRIRHIWTAHEPVSYTHLDVYKRQAQNRRFRGEGCAMKAGTQNSWAYDLAADLAGGVCYAVGMYVFAMHADFAPGGVSGLALLLNRLLGLPVGLGTLLLNLPLFALSYRFVGRRFLVRTLRSIMICVLLLDVVFPRFPAYMGEPFLAALYSGAVSYTHLDVYKRQAQRGRDLPRAVCARAARRLYGGAVPRPADLGHGAVFLALVHGYIFEENKHHRIHTRRPSRLRAGYHRARRERASGCARQFGRGALCGGTTR